MANAVALNMKFIAETSSIQMGGKETARMLSQLGNDVVRTASSFKSFAEDNEAAAKAQQDLTTDANLLAYQLKEGFINAEQFREAMEELTGAAKKQAAAFAEGASLTASLATEQEKHESTLARLQTLLEAGAISEETFARAVEQAESSLSSNTKESQDHFAALARGQQVAKSVATAEEKYAEAVDDLKDLLKQGAISQETFDRAMKKAADSMDDGGKEADSLSEQLKKVSGSLRTLVAIEFGKILAKGFSMATSAISNYVSSIRQSVDETAKLARQTGIAVEELQVFQLAAQMSGVDNLVEPIRKLGIEIGKAGESGNVEKFEKLGLNFNELARLAPEEQFKAIAAQIAALPTPAERAAAAVAIFGEQGVKMLPLFESNLAAVQERMERLGIVLSEDQTGNIEEMNDALTLVQSTFEGIIGQVVGNLAPAVTAIAEEFLSFVEGYEGLGDGTGGTALADSITTALFDGAEYLAGLLDASIEYLSEFGVSLQGFAETMSTVATVFTVVAETFRGLWNVLEAIVDGFRMFLGQALQAIGSWVSSGLEEMGKQIASDAHNTMMKNVGEAGQAFGNAANGIMGTPEQRASGEGMFSGAVRTGREAYDSRNDPAKQAEREAKRQEEQEARNAAVKEQERIRKEEEANKKIEEAAKKRQDEINKGEQKLFEASVKFEEERLDKLAAVNQKALKASDIRSGGIDQIMALATGREDPAVTEARKQVQELQKMREELRALRAMPVEIAGAA